MAHSDEGSEMDDIRPPPPSLPPTITVDGDQESGATVGSNMTTNARPGSRGLAPPRYFF